MIDTTPPQPGEHIPLPGQRSLLPDEPVGTEARAALREWWLLNRGPEEPPKVESLRKLDLQCDVGRDREFWQMVRAAATEDLGSLWARRYEWQQATEFGGADDAIADEVNLMLARLCGPEPTPAKESTMPAAVARRTKAPKSTKPKPAKPAAVEMSTTVKPELSGELVMIDVEDLHPSPYQTRNQPTAEWLKELGESLQRDGQLTPCLARVMPSSPILNDVPGLYQLIAGHTRTLAAKKLGWKSLQVRVVACDDETARRLVLVDNAKRKDLDAIEQAVALKGLVDAYADAGKSQRQLAVDIGVSQSEISNAVRLLALPETWQQRLITGEITKTQARELLPWCDVAALWPELDERLDGLSAEEVASEFDWELRQALFGCSRDMTPYVVASFKLTPEQRVALDVRKVEHAERAFNTDLWDDLQAAAEAKQKARAAKQAEKTEGKVAAGKMDPKEAAERHNKRLYRWKVAWLQRRVSDALAAMDVVDLLPVLLAWFAIRGSEGVQERRSELAGICGLKAKQSWHGADPLEIVTKLLALKSPERSSVLRSAIQLWVLHSIEGWNTDMPPAFVERLAEHLGIDIVRQWSNDRAYLELLTTAQLQGLGAEWKLSYPRAMKREPLIEWLLERATEKPCPKAVRGIKAVALH